MIASPDGCEAELEVLRSTDIGVRRVLPGNLAPLTWTIAAPALEFALRAALCGELRVLPWPPIGRAWYFVGRVNGTTVLNLDALDRAVAVATDRPRRTAWHVRRVQARTSGRAEANALAASGLRAGRLQADVTKRQADDLIATAGRLRDLAFQVWSHEAAVSLAVPLSTSGTRAEDVAAAVGTIGPVPLWGAPREEPEPASDDLGAGTAVGRALGDALKVSMAEIKVLADELGRRWEIEGIIDSQADIALLEWNELADIAVGRVPADAVKARVAGRRAQPSAARTVRGRN